MLIVFFSVFNVLHANTKILLIDDFETQRNFNLVGGMAGCWDRDPADESGYCKSEIITTNRDGKETFVLRLDYKLTSQDYNGYYTKLNGLDLRPFTVLSFWLKGGPKIPSIFKIELKNHTNEVGSCLISDISSSWKKISVPLQKFSGIIDWSKMTELVFVFEGSKLGDSHGSIYIDDISFESPEGEYKKRLAVIQRKEFEKILNLSEDEFLNFISKKTFEYFWNESSHVSGFIKDRSAPYSPASVAAIGFGLTAICIGEFRGWITHKEAYTRTKKILNSLKYHSAKEHGFFYHFIDLHKGIRAWNSEVSSIDTALLLAGVIVAREYFEEEDIKKLCDEIYLKVEWPWLVEQKSKTLYMGWTPEDGFKKFILWDMFGEEMIMYILGLGSPTYPLPENSWHSFRRPVKTFKDYTYIYCESESLFTYQFSHAFIDFRNKHDKYADYWNNSILATKSNREFCIEHKNKHISYREGYWGLSACDGPHGYKNYGATVFTHDGTIAPYAICASVPFIPNIAISTLRKLLFEYGEKVWGKYGFVSAFNLDEKWFSTEHVGIDLGITLLMIENYRSEFVWKYFMKNPYVKNGLKRGGFKHGSRELNVTYLKKKYGKEKHDYFGKKFIAKKRTELVSEADFVKFSLPDDIEFG
ncbi:MAG: glucoamylase family protein, partial [Elusimicrobiota bacterium]|nr:glucoamylase family protein [Elusimicrobiota bacterium]